MKKVYAKTIYKENSPISGEIVVRDNGTVRELFIKGTKQTSWSEDEKIFEGTYWKAATTLSFNKKNPKFLVVGLGGGTIPKLLVNKYPQSSVLAIEIDPMIIDIARNLFEIKNLPQIKIIEGNANNWIARNYKKYANQFDAIFLDTFFGEVFSFDTQLVTLRKVQEMLSPKGVMITNRIYNEYEDSVEKYIQELGELFTEQTTYVVEGYSGNDNIIIFSRSTS